MESDFGWVPCSDSIVVKTVEYRFVESHCDESHAVPLQRPFEDSRYCESGFSTVPPKLDYSRRRSTPNKRSVSFEAGGNHNFGRVRSSPSFQGNVGSRKASSGSVPGRGVAVGRGVGHGVDCEVDCGVDCEVDCEFVRWVDREVGHEAD